MAALMECYASSHGALIDMVRSERAAFGGHPRRTIKTVSIGPFCASGLFFATAQQMPLNVGNENLHRGFKPSED